MIGEQNICRRICTGIYLAKEHDDRIVCMCARDFAELIPVEETGSLREYTCSDERSQLDVDFKDYVFENISKYEK